MLEVMKKLAIGIPVILLILVIGLYCIDFINRLLDRFRWPKMLSKLLYLLAIFICLALLLGVAFSIGDKILRATGLAVYQ